MDLEMAELFEIAGLDLAKLESYRRRFCGEASHRREPQVN
jgi:hypothetical protein